MHAIANTFRKRLGLAAQPAGELRVTDDSATLPLDDARIIQQFLQTGDDALFAQLVERYQQRVFRLAISILGHGREADSEDVAQLVFVRVFQQLSRFRGESRFSTWLYRIAWNCALDEKNRMTRAAARSGAEDALAFVEAAPASDPLSSAVAQQRRARLHAALAELPETYQMTLRLHYWLGCTVEEIAELLGTSAGTVKSYLFRARARLQRELPPEGGTR